MARITVEDALPLVPNRFELVVLAARRARELSLGERPLVARDERLPDPEVIMDLASAGVAEEDGEGDDASDDGGPDGSLAD